MGCPWKTKLKIRSSVVIAVTSDIFKKCMTSLLSRGRHLEKLKRGFPTQTSLPFFELLRFKNKFAKESTQVIFVC